MTKWKQRRREREQLVRGPMGEMMAKQMHPTSCDCMKGSSFEQVNYYTTPPQRKPLTDEEFLELILRTGTQELVGVTAFLGQTKQTIGVMQLLRSAKIIKEFVEAAHGIKEKNT